MPQSLLEEHKDRLFAAGFDIDDTIGRETGLAIAGAKRSWRTTHHRTLAARAHGDVRHVAVTKPTCNLYSLTKGQQAICELARAMRDLTGNLPLMAGIYPDYGAPIVRNAPAGRELTMTRWGMPSPLAALKGRKSDPGVTNIRNVKSPHWRRWLGVEHRCVVPFTSSSEYETLPAPKPPV